VEENNKLIKITPHSQPDRTWILGPPTHRPKTR
jgi:hypothetical protein